MLTVFLYRAPFHGGSEMKKMILASLLLNVFVLIPVCFSLMTNQPWAVEMLGAFTPARGFLLSLWGTILVVSLGLLFKREPMLVAPLFLLQIIYKLTTPFTVGSFTNPVVISNVAIALFHLITLSLIIRALQRTASSLHPAE